MGVHAAENNTKASQEPVLLSVFPHLSKHTGLRTKDLERPRGTSPFGRASNHHPATALPLTTAQTPDPVDLSATCVTQHPAPVRLRMWCEPGNPIPDSSELQGFSVCVNHTHSDTDTHSSCVNNLKPTKH